MGVDFIRIYLAGINLVGFTIVCRNFISDEGPYYIMSMS